MTITAVISFLHPCRRDGSSRFYKDSRWGTFFSVGAGWRIDEERFMEDIDFIDLLKLRVA